jgi:NADH:ubiquinone oxidoreductase subunit 4 (subunit M)
MTVVADLTWAETGTAAFLMFWILLLGWMAAPLLQLSVHSVDHFVQLFAGGGR